MNQKEVWRGFIRESKILKHKSNPIVIDKTKGVHFDKLQLNLSIDQEIFKQEFKTQVEK